ncbi:hypothetical protein AMS58_10450 [Pseudoalteromonas porphyrae]|uniref:hypothetical protein n=1 Tax=Pseudoalteromonas TaxID=53246 RepID=UPI0006BAA9A4|nr:MULTISPECIES: hypothetical protein [Pseudoalteromonas]KPH94669.1 hypothetical protein AMS58_10450 [Pseudoalteromonas porphyrae]
MNSKIIREIYKSNKNFSHYIKNGGEHIFVFNKSSGELKLGITINVFRCKVSTSYWASPMISFPFIDPIVFKFRDENEDSHINKKLQGATDSYVQEVLENRINSLTKAVNELVEIGNFYHFLKSRLNELGSFQKANFYLLCYFVNKDFNIYDEAKEILPKLNKHNPITISFIDFLSILKNSEDERMDVFIKKIEIGNKKKWEDLLTY